MTHPRILAMYDIRGKQSYIYKSTKIKEIIGASLIIRDCFADYLYPAALMISEKGIYDYKKAGDNELRFSHEGFEEHLTEGYIGETVYDGGGNFFVLYRDAEVYREVNRIFSREVLKNTYSLRVLTSYVEIMDYNDYMGDQRRLRRIHAVNERRECTMPPVNAMPIVQVDRQSSLPLTGQISVPGGVRKVTSESAAKYKKYEESADDRSREGVRILDDMITGKGVDSHLAVIYIDGNGMGAKVERVTRNCTDYDSAVTALRRFSGQIQREYIDDPMDAIDSYFRRKKNRRSIVRAGDEVTFICNAKDAYEVVNTYLEALTEANVGNSSCAGVAIFHSHAPYAEAYRIAEECCETGKAWMKKNGIQEACLMDFHYCQGAIGISLEEIRESDGTTELCQPWLLRGADDMVQSVPRRERVEETAELLRRLGHSNAKNLLYAARDGEAAFERELQRILAHMPGNDRQQEISDGITVGSALKGQKLDRALVYRIMLVYDLWFRDTAEEKGDERHD